ncbi:MAG: hypothetical protein JW849_02140 [Phycisphaerae bacterium]|nr:hypothetical protein [Phycisphaerae bacterium]
MFTKRLLALLLVVGFSVGGVFAQEAAQSQPVGPDPDQPQAESVYKHIPADCLGFLAAKNLNGLLKSISTFAGQIGMGEQLEAMGPGGLLPMMAAMLQLGGGYNPNGGVAVVMMDFEKCGIDVDKMISGEEPDIDMPIVVLLAGTSIEKAFPTQAQKDEAGQWSVMLPMGGMPPMKAVMVGDYIALSPNPKALALLKTDASIETNIPAGQKKLLAASDVVFHENFTVLAPFIKKLVAKAQEDAQAAQEGDVPGGGDLAQTPFGPMLMMMGPMTEMLDDVLSLSYGLRFIDDGMMIDVAVDYKPGSVLAKIVQANTPTGKPLMNRLPNLPYVVAAGAVYTHDPEGTKQMIKIMEMLLATGDLEMPADLKDRLTVLSEQLSEELTGVQLVGGPSKEKGVFGLGIVLECKDAEKTRALLPKKAELLTELVQKTVAVKEVSLADLTFTFVEGAEKLGETSVDAIVVDSTKLRELTDEEKKDMIDVLSEDQIRFLVAKADEKTLVVTLGGGTEVLAEVLQAAQNGGTIPADPGVVKALAKLPSQRIGVMVFSPKNLFDAVQAGMKKVGEPSNLPEDFAFENDVPMAMTSTVEGTTAQGTMYIPSAAVKDIVMWGMAEAAAARAAMTPPPGDAPPPPVKDQSDF